MGPLKSCRSWLQSPLSLLALPLAAHTSPLTVTTTSGTVQGYSPHDSVNAFLGIPYAQPPVGPMRFKPPQPFENKSNTIIDGSVFGKSCFQFVYKTPIVDRGGPLTGESEDCLTLNIWVPQGGNTTGLLPTLVWIHGGGFVSGSSSISSKMIANKNTEPLPRNC